MAYHDVFNGDADGICALHQLRLAEPREATIVTGLKRDIALLRSVAAREGDVVTVLDVSLDRNRAALLELLDRGVAVHYFDHHYAGDVPSTPRLHAVLDDSPRMCTSAIVNRHLGGRFAIWAAVGAFGDALDDTAGDIARPLGLDADGLAALRELGRSINYNAYGETEEDVLIPPSSLYRLVSKYADPFELIEREPLVARLARARVADIERACALAPMRATGFGDVWLLPDEAWARRANGTFANRLAADEPHKAHAVLTPKKDGGYVVSVRCAAAQERSAVEFCRAFGGGGRATAAGIDCLQAGELDSFIAAFDAAWTGARAG